MGVYNKLRSKAHKRYNRAKRDYRYIENKIVRYKQERCENGREIDPIHLLRMRNNLKIVVDIIKLLKKQMSQYNREWNADEDLMRECRNLRKSQRKVNELYNEKYGGKRNM